MKEVSFGSLRAGQKWLALFNRKIAGIKDRCIGDRKPIRKVIKSYMSLRIEGRDGSVNQIIIENCVIGLNEVEVVEVFEVVLGEKSEKWGGNVWGKEKNCKILCRCGENVGKSGK